MLNAGNYFPTIDYRNYIFDSINDEKFDNIKNEIKYNMFKIIKAELNYFKQNKNDKSRFEWLNENNFKCSAGRDMYAINTNGNIYECHGCLMLKSENDHNIGNIIDNNIIEKITINRNNHIINEEKNIDTICKNCDAKFCLRCNASKYEKSNKKEYYEKWFDFTCQPKLCELYKYISNISYAFDKRRELIR